MKDHEIVRLLKSNHPDGLKQLLKEYRPFFYYIITPILPNEQDREDCISEIGKLLLTHRESYELKEKLKDFWIKNHNKQKNKSTDDKIKISIVENWEIYKREKLQNVDDDTKLELFKNEFLGLDSPYKIKNQKFTIDFSDNIDAQDMLMKIMKIILMHHLCLC